MKRTRKSSAIRDAILYLLIALASATGCRLYFWAGDHTLELPPGPAPTPQPTPESSY